MDNKHIFTVLLSLAYYSMLEVQCSITDNHLNNSELNCRGQIFKNVSLTAYYADDERDEPETYLDVKGNTLKTLQDFIDDTSDYVTVSMDEDLKIPYGTMISIPELNVHFRRPINFQIRDTASNVKGQGFKRVDICVRSEADSYDHIVNLKSATLVMQNYI